ncbi:PAS and ANTAR domain-containing protein [Nocardia sp. NPDC058705]|uniref:PAS and ANTAR domain-containing protein n=1 Tax=Nocardia sp. NPDC058705 TaxID=3346609 RepID=UPI0036BD37A9
MFVVKSNEQSVPEAVAVINTVIGAEACMGVGTFRYWFADGRWEWSDELAAIYGYQPGEVEPTTELLLSHQHPDDQEELGSAVTAAVNAGDPVCGRHRIVDTEGRIHEVFVVGDHMTDEDGTVIGTTGHYIDVTERLEEERRDTLDETVPELVEARAEIEQAKGALILMYGISADQAFKVLRWRSQETNMKLRDIAAQIVADVRSINPHLPGCRTRFDHLLLTVHQRRSES